MTHVHAFSLGPSPAMHEDGDFRQRCACSAREPEVSEPAVSAPLPPCPSCGIRHTDQGTLTVRDPDDEIVGCGCIHVERMDKGSVWVGMEAPDGTRVDLDLYATKGKLRMPRGVRRVRLPWLRVGRRARAGWRPPQGTGGAP